MSLFLMIFPENVGFFLLKINQMFLDTFIKFYSFISNTTSFKIINVKSDHGTEYINKNSVKFMESKGFNFIHSTSRKSSTKWSC